MCTFRATCFSTRLSRAQVPVPLSGTGDKKGGGSKEGVRGDRLHWWVQGSTSSLTGFGSRRRVSSELKLPFIYKYHLFDTQ